MKEFLMQNPWIFLAAAAWTLPWKGIALWKAAKSNSKVWFVVLFLINTLAVLDIIYIVFGGKKKNEDEESPMSNPTILSNGKRIV